MRCDRLVFKFNVISHTNMDDFSFAKRLNIDYLSVWADLHNLLEFQYTTPMHMFYFNGKCIVLQYHYLIWSDGRNLRYTILVMYVVHLNSCAALHTYVINAAQKCKIREKCNSSYVQDIPGLIPAR
jgi:hypothetical protein